MRLIVTDLDNTLLNKEKDITPFTCAALNAVRERGMLVVFATARPERATKRLQEVFCPDYIIANNGATLVKDGNVLWNDCIDDDVLADFARDVFAEKAVDSVSIEMGDRIYQDYEDLAWGGKDDWNPMIVDVRNVKLTGVPKFSTHCAEHEKILAIVGKYPGLSCFFNMSEEWQQIQRSDVGKLNAVIRLAEMLDIDMSDVAAFGDDHNDEDMLRGCGIGVAVDNAAPGAKTVAKYTCPSCADDGVAKWIMENIKGF